MYSLLTPLIVLLVIQNSGIMQDDESTFNPIIFKINVLCLLEISPN